MASPAVNASGTSLAVPLSLRVNVSWTVAGNAIYAACQWGVLIAIARLGSPEAVGQFALALAITAPILIFSQLQLRAVQATDARREFAFGHYLTLRLITTVLAVGAVGVVISLLGYDRNTAVVISTIALAKAFDAVTDAFIGRWQQDERMDAVALTYIAGGAGFLLAAVPALAVGGGAAAVGAVWAGTAALKLVWVAVRSRRTYGSAGCEPSSDLRTVSAIARLALPLGLCMMLVSLSGSIPRFVLEWHRGIADLGVFAAIAYFTVAGSTVMTAVGQAMAAPLSRSFARDDVPRTVALAGRLLGVAGVLGGAGLLASIVAGPAILRWFYGPAYAGAATVFVVVMLSTALFHLASALGYTLTAAREFTSQLPVFVLVTVATAVSALLLVPRLGATGAAWSLACGAAVQVIGCAVLVARCSARRRT